MTRSLRNSAWIALLLLIAPGGAAAHGGASAAMATVAIDGPAARYTLTLTDIPPGKLADEMRLGQPGAAPDYRALPAALVRHIGVTGDGTACRAGAPVLRPPSATDISIEASVTFTCSGEARQLFIRDDLPDTLGPDHHTFTLVLWPEGSDQYTFDATAREIAWSAKQGIQPVVGAAGAFNFGLAHFSRGYVHLLFLLALMLGTGTMRAWLGIITAFALAHGMAMALPVSATATLSPGLTDAVMFLAMAWIAAQNLLPRYAIAPGWVVATAIGLLHGLASAPAAQDFALAANGRLSGLLAYTAGLWTGQAIIVAMALPVMRLWQGRPWASKVAPVLSVFVLAAGIYLLLERSIPGG